MPKRNEIRIHIQLVIYKGRSHRPIAVFTSIRTATTIRTVRQIGHILLNENTYSVCVIDGIGNVLEMIYETHGLNVQQQVHALYPGILNSLKYALCVFNCPLIVFLYAKFAC